MIKPRFKFSHRSGNLYYWISTRPVSPFDSRYEEIYCDVDWFWSK